VFVRSILGVSAAAAVMGLVVFAARMLMVDAGVPAALRLVLASALGVVVFGGLCAWRVPELRSDVRSLLGPRLRMPRAATAKP
jgi:hypothetical protein